MLANRVICFYWINARKVGRIASRIKLSVELNCQSNYELHIGRSSLECLSGSLGNGIKGLNIFHSHCPFPSFNNQSPELAPIYYTKHSCSFSLSSYFLTSNSTSQSPTYLNQSARCISPALFSLPSASLLWHRPVRLPLKTKIGLISSIVSFPTAMAPG